MRPVRPGEEKDLLPMRRIVPRRAGHGPTSSGRGEHRMPKIRPGSPLGVWLRRASHPPPRDVMLRFVLALLLGAASARADGPDDNLPDKVRPVPPPGIRI